MTKKRAKVKGRKRGGRRQSRRPARVKDPGLFYALRAVVALLLHLFAVRKLTPEGEKRLLEKLDIWYTEARDWKDQPRASHPENGPVKHLANVPRKRTSSPRMLDTHPSELYAEDEGCEPEEAEDEHGV